MVIIIPMESIVRTCRDVEEGSYARSTDAREARHNRTTCYRAVLLRPPM